MASTNSKQMIAGKSFEYALLIQFEEKLKNKTHLEVVKNSSFEIAKKCFEYLDSKKQGEYLLYASFAINFLIDVEPRLSNDITADDVLQLEILSDDHGKAGDVRDVLAIRLLQKWEIGVSAKNNHKAVKHSRLSANVDFGTQWLGLKTSEEYFSVVVPIFNNLEKIRKESGAKKKWKELGDYKTQIYISVLDAFVKELNNLYNQDPKKVAANLIQYLVGTRDFYKVIKQKNKLEIQAYNLNGTLNLSFKDVSPKYTTPRVLLPTEIIDIGFKKKSKTTVIVTMNNDWALSFRIHNASSRVEPSLKFDINLLKSPKQLFKNTLNIS